MLKQLSRKIDRPLARSHADTPRPDTCIRIRGLSKRFRARGGTVTAFEDMSLDIAAGERVVLLGPSGCGKTTLLRCVAGLEQPDAGEIGINGRLVYASDRGLMVPPEQRGVSMVFQSYALWPHMTIFGNVAYPLRYRNGGRGGAARAPAIDSLVMDALRLVGCDGLADRYPNQISGGQQQRVALARAIVGSDGIILFDEPLSNVDAKVREQLRIELVLAQKKLNFATLYVTHDQVEAAAVADRIIVMRAGGIAQIGTPQEIFTAPNSRHVAEFIGASNSVSGRVLAYAPEGVTIDTALGVVLAHSVETLRAGQDVDVVFRPDHVRLTAEAGPHGWGGRIESAMFLGLQTEHVLRVGGQQIVARGPHIQFDDGAMAWANVEPQHLHAFARTAA